ncbi:MAG: hypothetical protein ACI84C_002604 [Flavobacteriales bacterium]|jgi:hypothetical protein
MGFTKTAIGLFGIEKHQLEIIQIYPNSVQEMINIEANQSLEGANYRILNLSGQNNSRASNPTLTNAQIDLHLGFISLRCQRLKLKCFSGLLKSKIGSGKQEQKRIVF